jgi:hypothetical protein
MGWMGYSFGLSWCLVALLATTKLLTSIRSVTGGSLVTNKGDETIRQERIG